MSSDSDSEAENEPLSKVKGRQRTVMKGETSHVLRSIEGNYSSRNQQCKDWKRRGQIIQEGGYSLHQLVSRLRCVTQHHMKMYQKEKGTAGKGGGTQKHENESRGKQSNNSGLEDTSVRGRLSQPATWVQGVV